MQRTILHADLNNFYASVECLYHPELRNKPVAVCGNIELRHGIVLAKNMIAKQYGVATGNTLWQAKQKCPDIVFVLPDYKKYLKYSKMAREIYAEYSGQVESFGLDECWIDVSKDEALYGSGKEIADKIRKRILEELGVTVSIGVSFNKIFAKLGSDLKKPNATTVITKENFQQIVWPLPVNALLYVGKQTEPKLKKLCIGTIGELAKAEVSILQKTLGKMGVLLWQFANGLDQSPVAEIDACPHIKSIGNSTTTPYDLKEEKDIKIILYILSESIAERLREIRLKASGVQISIRDQDLLYYERQGKLPFPSCTSDAIFEKAFSLYQRNYTKNIPIRSIGVRAYGLCTNQIAQLSLLPEVLKLEKKEKAEQAIHQIRNRFGHFSVQRGIMLENATLSNLDPKKDHIIHPVGFFQ